MHVTSIQQKSHLLNAFTSDEFPLKFGVPQGSVLGLILLNVYTAPLEAIITSNEIHYHKYAGDN